MGKRGLRTVQEVGRVKQQIIRIIRARFVNSQLRSNGFRGREPCSPVCECVLR